MAGPNSQERQLYRTFRKTDQRLCDVCKINLLCKVVVVKASKKLRLVNIVLFENRWSMYEQGEVDKTMEAWSSVKLQFACLTCV